MNDNPGVVTGVRVTHQYATVDEIAAAGADTQREQVARLLEEPGVREAFALQTCNRAEAYVVTDRPVVGRAALDDFAPAAREGSVVRSGHEESLRHLMRVAAGLESMVLGEDQILGQLATAYEDARREDGIGPVLEEAITKARRVGERAREETAINEGSLSLGSAAVERVRSAGVLEDAAALVVGTGEMGTIVARHLDDGPIAELTVANRTVPHAEHLAETVSTTARGIGLDAVDTAASEADVVVTATGSSEPVIGPDAFSGETFVVDLARPRDVDPAVEEQEHVTVHDLDSLEDVTDVAMASREQAAETVEAIIDREFEHLIERFKRQRADEAIAAMHESAGRLRDREVSTALSRLEATGELTDDQREVVESLGDALVQKLLAPPTDSLRDAAEEDDWETIRTALELFDPDLDAPVDGATPPDSVPEGARPPADVLEGESGGPPPGVLEDD
jgi:glutamyl-tRNA reductase